MVFVHPLFLWALTAIAVPVIIHLFNFRRYKKIYFTNVKFLKELQQESKSKSRLREILILAARCLAIACLVLAFSQPYIPNNKQARSQAGVHAVSLYIDNSFSMENISRQGPLLEVAKARAKEVVKAFGGADRFQVITNDFEGRHQRFNNKEDILNLIDEVKISSTLRPLSEVIKRQEEFLNSSGIDNRQIFVFSDAQKSTFNLEAIPNDTAIRTVLVPLRANQVNNVYVDSCWFESPLQQRGFIQKLHATIVNNGSSAIEAGTAKLFLNKQQIALSSFSLAARARNEVQFTFECKQSGFNFGSVKIEDFPITFDDELFFAFNSRIHIAVSLINGRSVEATNAFSSLFKADSLFELRSFPEQMIDYNLLRSSDVVILNQLSGISSGLVSELMKLSAKGGALVVIPSAEADLVLYNAAFSGLGLPVLGSLDTTSLKTERLETAARFYNGVFEKMEERVNLPLVTRHYHLQQTNRSDFEPVLKLENGESFFGASHLNGATVYLFSTPLDKASSNFSQHALFVPTFYQICFQSLTAAPLFYPAGSNVIIRLKNEGAAQEAPPHILQIDKQLDVIPEMRRTNNSLLLYTRHQISAPGFYQITGGGDPLLPLAFNYPRKESDLEAYTAGELSHVIQEKGFKKVSLLEDAQGGISSRVLQDLEGKRLWKLFIILTLLFIATEVLLLRLLK